MTNQIWPWFSVAEDPPGLRADDDLLAVSGLTAKFDPPVEGHCGSGVGPALVAWIRPKVRPTPLTWKKSVSLPPQQGHQY